MLLSSSPVRSMRFKPSLGGWTMNCRGIVMRCGEQAAHTTLPHFLQWCFLCKNVKFLPHTGHCETSASGCQGGRAISLTLLGVAGLFGSAYAGGGGGGGASVAGSETGEELRTMGSEVDVPGLLECILMLEGRRMGDSAVVRRLLRSELSDELESERGGGRFGSAYRGEDA
jgi:hypothetical protein